MENEVFYDIEINALKIEKALNYRLVECLQAELKKKIIELQNELKKSYILDDNDGEEQLNANLDSDDKERIYSIKLLIENQSKLVNAFFDGRFSPTVNGENKISQQVSNYKEEFDAEARNILEKVKQKKLRLQKFKHHLLSNFTFVSTHYNSSADQTLESARMYIPSVRILPTSEQSLPSVAASIYLPVPNSSWDDVIGQINDLTNVARNFPGDQDGAHPHSTIERLSEITELISQLARLTGQLVRLPE